MEVKLYQNGMAVPGKNGGINKNWYIFVSTARSLISRPSRALSLSTYQRLQYEGIMGTLRGGMAWDKRLKPYYESAGGGPLSFAMGYYPGDMV